MQLLHAAGKTRASFDDPNLVSHGGLVPAMRLAELVGLEDLVAHHVRVNAEVGANAGVKIGSLIAGMIAGADDIDDMDLLRHGAIPATFGGIRAPSTLGSFLRAFHHGNVRQLSAVHRRVLAELATRTPLLPGGEALAFIDVDSTQKQVYGPDKQGAAFGHAKIASKSLTVRGLNALLATVCTPLAAPVITTTRLRGGNAASARGAATLAAEAISAARAAGVSGLIVVRADSAFDTGRFVAACRRNGAHFSVTVPMRPKIRAAISSIDEDAWTAIKYPNAVFDEQARRWISDAEIAEVPYTAFASTPTHATRGRLIVRRVRDLAPRATTENQGELFAAYRYHAMFTDSPFELAQAESQHRGHAIIEQVFADLADGPLAHLPSGQFNANAAWLQLAATAHTLTRALGVLASPEHAVARNATIRTQLINVAARPARTGRDTITWHLPRDWPWEQHWLNAFHATHRGPPALAA
ncbi:Transposase [Mycobacterium canettii CIPT 140060008]|uniref:IS1380 family transposase n=1 Tax=Mycobacterium canetti TaxID=78331 RepID=UPI0002A56FB8|nr:IS1380 family transposase [Mycobacterium canetti]CCK53257.1 Transposase [Mycobacterium canettii CIPT 140060008]